MIRLLCVGLLLLGSLFPVRLCAQQYDTMWKQVEDLQKKDLVESVIGAVDGIYRKAEAERNLPQLMKAFLVRSSYKIALTPDSLEAERQDDRAAGDQPAVQAADLVERFLSVLDAAGKQAAGL